MCQVEEFWLHRKEARDLLGRLSRGEAWLVVLGEALLSLDSYSAESFSFWSWKSRKQCPSHVGVILSAVGAFCSLEDSQKEMWTSLLASSSAKQRGTPPMLLQTNTRAVPRKVLK